MKFFRSISVLILFVLLYAQFQTTQAENEPPWRQVVRPGPCTAGSSATDLVEDDANDIVYFKAMDGYNSGTSNGSEIWRSDGSESGTWRVTNLAPGEASLNVDLRIVVGDKLYFTTKEPENAAVHKQRLWVTDGAPAVDGQVGAVKLDDFWPFASQYSLAALTELDGKLYFIVNSNSTYIADSISQLWVTDGSIAGTRPVITLSIPTQVEKMEAFKGYVYFHAYSSGGLNLWRSDGTTAGTGEFTTLTNSTPWSPDLIPAGDHLYFVASSNNKTTLWKTDGTVPGTGEVYPTEGAPQNLGMMGSYVYFVIPSGNYSELWRSNGTPAGTEKIRQFGDFFSMEGPLEMTAVGNTLYFVAAEPDQSREVWKTDGTQAGTVQVSHLYPAVDAYAPSQLTAFGDRLYFLTYAAAGWSRQLWVTDGQASGTEMLLDNSAYTLSHMNEPSIATSGNRLFLGMMAACMGAELQAIDVPGDSPRVVKDINADLTFMDIRREMVEYKEQTYFIGNDFIHGYELWRSDGTPVGTQMFKDINPTGSAFGISDGGDFLKPAGNLLYFTANAGPTGGSWRVWKTDGSQDGTQPVRTALGTTIDGIFKNPIAFQNGLFFFRQGSSDAELWRTDGTPAGTIKLGILPGPGDGVELNNKLYFLVTYSSMYTPQLWETDGTADGTKMTAAVTTPSSQFPDRTAKLVKFKDKLYFCHDDASSSKALWTTDGTTGGTTRLVDIGAWDRCSLEGGNNVLYILAANISDGFQISKLNSAGDALTKLHETGDRLLKDQTVVGDQLYFRDSEPGSWDESLWTSNGTTSGTQELMPDSGPVQFELMWMRTSNSLFFTAQEAGTGTELWMTNGTPDGTHLAADVWPGPDSSNPNLVGVDSNRLWFRAADGSTTAGPNNDSFFVYALEPGLEKLFLPLMMKGN